MILHIPHSSRTVPEGLRDQFVLTDAELLAQLDLMTDAFTEELFAMDAATVVRCPLSRLVVDRDELTKSWMTCAASRP